MERFVIAFSRKLYELGKLWMGERLAHPVGEVIESTTRPNGMRINKVRVPIGVIGIIYESRPNVTVDCAVLCLKSGNAAILRGGSDAINSNKAIVKIIRKTLTKCGICQDAVQLIENTSRERLSFQRLIL